jgi:hypothetical protein
MDPLLWIEATAAPESMAMAVLAVLDLLLPLAATVPATLISGTDAPLPMRIAVPLLFSDVAWTLPPTATPPAMATLPPSPPMTSPRASTSL